MRLQVLESAGAGIVENIRVDGDYTALLTITPENRKAKKKYYSLLRNSFDLIKQKFAFEKYLEVIFRSTKLYMNAFTFIFPQKT